MAEEIRIPDRRRNYPSTIEELREFERRFNIRVTHGGGRPLTLRETLSGPTAKTTADRENYPSTLAELREFEQRYNIRVTHNGERPKTLRETLSEIGLTAERHDCSDIRDEEAAA